MVIPTQGRLIDASRAEVRNGESHDRKGSPCAHISSATERRSIPLLYWVLAFALFILLASTGLVDGLLKIETWNVPSCGDGNCEGQLSISVALDLDFGGTWSKTWTQYANPFNSSKVYTLDYPLEINMTTAKPKLVWDIRYSRTYQNAYEGFEADSTCSVAYGIGPCVDKSSQPPGEYGDYYTCCGQSAVAVGQRCLRYNYSTNYDRYFFASPEIVHEVEISVRYGPQHQYTFSVGSEVPAGSCIDGSEGFDCTAYLVIDRDQSLGTLLTTFGRERAIFLNRNDGISALEPNVTNRFFLVDPKLGQFKKLNLNAQDYFSQSNCNLDLHSLTRTHFESGHEEDQFYVWKRDSKLVSSLLDAGLQIDGNSFNFTSSQQLPGVTPPTLYTAFRTTLVANDGITVTLQLEDISHPDV